MSMLITTRDGAKYDALVDIHKYSEKSLQNWLLKYKKILFSDYYCFSSGYNFVNHKGERSAADIILIAKDFSKWIIVEVELASKSLSHTKYQLSVFTDVKLNVEGFSKHCQRKEQVFHKNYQKELEKCLNTKPEVHVIYDAEDKAKSSELLKYFNEIALSYCEIYRSLLHSSHILRVHGKRNYVVRNTVYLTPDTVYKNMYTVSDPKFFQGLDKKSRLDYVADGRVGRIDIIRTKTGIKLKIDDSPFNIGSVLFLEKSINNMLYMKAVN